MKGSSRGKLPSIILTMGREYCDPRDTWYTWRMIHRASNEVYPKVPKNFTITGLVCAFNQEKALVWAFSVIVKPSDNLRSKLYWYTRQTWPDEVLQWTAWRARCWSCTRCGGARRGATSASPATATRPPSAGGSSWTSSVRLIWNASEVLYPSTLSSPQSGRWCTCRCRRCPPAPGAACSSSATWRPSPGPRSPGSGAGRGAPRPPG